GPRGARGGAARRACELDTHQPPGRARLAPRGPRGRGRGARRAARERGTPAHGRGDGCGAGGGGGPRPRRGPRRAARGCAQGTARPPEGARARRGHDGQPQAARDRRRSVRGRARGHAAHGLARRLGRGRRDQLRARRLERQPRQPPRPAPRAGAQGDDRRRRSCGPRGCGPGGCGRRRRRSGCRARGRPRRAGHARRLRGELPRCRDGGRRRLRCPAARPLRGPRGDGRPQPRERAHLLHRGHRAHPCAARSRRAGQARVRSRLARATAGLLGAAAMIAVVTVVARVLGFVRSLVFGATVGFDAVGDAYNAANTLPNVVFEIAAGGALAGAVVPVLAVPLARGMRADVDRTASALVGWVLAVLVPLAAVLAALAHPLAGLVSREAEGRALVAGLLAVFAVQVPLYGLAVVLSGVLQAQKKFVWPAFAPVMSRLVVIGSYLAFAAVADGAQTDPAQLSAAAFGWLAWGTTAGVAALSLPLLVPVRRSGVRLRPTLRFPAGTGRRVRSLAAAGLGGLL